VHETAAHNLAEIFRGSNCFAGAIALCWRPMSEPDEIPPVQNYQWPKFALAAVVLFFVLAVVWMSFFVKREKQERDLNAPLPSSSPAH
jgi:protein-S-isoprenylcysteine O-methyltransferase Ste14